MSAEAAQARGQRPNGRAIRNGRVSVDTISDRPDINPGDGICRDRKGRCSLRAAIDEANESGSGLRISLQRNRKFTLRQQGAGEDGNARGDLDVRRNVTIIGRNAIVNAARSDRALHVHPGARLTIGRTRIANGAPSAGENGGAILVSGRLVLKSVRVLKSAVTGTGASGGGIFNAGGSVLLVDSQVNRNAASAGGAIAADGGTTLLRRTRLLVNSAGVGGGLQLGARATANIRASLIDRNSATVDGGGVWIAGTSAIGLADTDVTRNRAAGVDVGQGGGGLYSDGGRVRVDRGEISSNRAAGVNGSGGAALNRGGRLLVFGTELRTNTANRAGGAVETVGGLTGLTRATLVGNATGNAPGNGGAVHLGGDGVVEVAGSTLTGNIASAEGGALWNSDRGRMIVTDTTLNGNTAGGNDPDQGGGAIYNDGGRIDVDRGVLAENRAVGANGSGGAILNVRGILDVTGAELRVNSARRAGGAIETNLGSVTLASTRVLQNSAAATPGSGGGLHVTGAATVAISDSDVSRNSASAEGGGLWNSDSGTLTVARTSFVGNVAGGAEADQGGGALYNDGGRATVAGGTLADNQAAGTNGSGGAILNVRGALTISDAELRGNSARRAGGGIETNLGSVALTRVALVGNVAAGAPGNGGGLHTTGAGTVAIAAGSVVGNRAAAEGGGLWNSATGTMTVTGTAISGNTAPSGADVFSQPPGGRFTIDGNPVAPTR
ncbi:MAG TPA: hypothetical protein VLK58_21435 [Conexibacter sp.]|nr:hypothetical protein [Conexibacter sp.]